MKNILCLVLVSVLLLACSSTREDLGLERRDFNASRAKEQQQLLLPPNYDLLPSIPQQQISPHK